MLKQFTKQLYKKNILMLLTKAVLVISVVIIGIIFMTQMVADILNAVLNTDSFLFIQLIWRLLLITTIYLVAQTLNSLIDYHLQKVVSNALEDEVIDYASRVSSWEQSPLPPNETFVRLVNNVRQVASGTINLVFDLITIFLSIVFGLAYAFSVNIICTIISLVIMLITFFIAKKNFIILPKIKKQISQLHNKTYGFVWQNIINMEIVGFLDINQVLRHNQEYTDLNIELNKQAGKINAKNSLIQKINTTGIILIISISIALSIILDIQYISIPHILILFITIPKVSASFYSLFDWYTSYSTWTGDKNLVQEIFEQKIYDEAGKIGIETIQTIDLDNVTLRLNDTCILKDLTMHAQYGEFIGIVGETGRGKSTVLKLCMGLFETYEGQVQYNGMNIKQINRNDLWEHVTYVPQKDILINGTILQNIILDAVNVDCDALQTALKIANAEDVIQQLPDGLNTRTEALNLSSGERQRLILARALYSERAEVWFFDEATSAIDPGTQMRIITGIKDHLQKKNKIALWITHDRTVLHVFDHILDLDLSGELGHV